MRVIADDSMLEGYQALMRDERVVWLGQIGLPIEDADFDTLILHPNDYPGILALVINGEHK